MLRREDDVVVREALVLVEAEAEAAVVVPGLAMRRRFAAFFVEPRREKKSWSVRGGL